MPDRRTAAARNANGLVERVHLRAAARLDGVVEGRIGGSQGAAYVRVLDQAPALERA